MISGGESDHDHDGNGNGKEEVVEDSGGNNETATFRRDATMQQSKS